MEKILSTKWESLICKNCDKDFVAPKRTKQKFCSRECLNFYRANANLVTLKCSNCKKEIERKEHRLARSRSKLYFCSTACKNESCSLDGSCKEIQPSHYGTGSKRFYNCELCERPTQRVNRICLKCSYNHYIDLWKKGLASGNITSQEGIIGYVRKYIYEKYDSKCVKCGWDEINTAIGKSPLAIHHIDGNSANSTEINLELLCPNCHSLTHNFCGLNRGKGRPSRQKLNK